MLRLRSAAIVVGFLIPITTFAAPPPPVTGLSGMQEANGEVRIEWQPSSDSTVVRYRLYYSAESILESEGVYDDFEETQGMENVYVFTTPPATKEFYVTVLAVNSLGEESDAFVEEVRIDLSQAQPANTPRLETSSSSASMEPPPPVLMVSDPASSSAATESSSSQASVPTYADPVKDGRVHLLLAEALSPIQVKLTFSDPVSVDPQSAPQAFSIIATGGMPLRIAQIQINENIVIADTEQQQRSMVYSVRLSEPLQGVHGEPLDPTDRTALFTGHEQGKDPTTAQQPNIPSYDPQRPADVTGFVLRATPEQGGTYTVTAQWQPDISRGDIAHYIVRQSLDGGQTFGDPQMVPMDIAGVEFRGVQPGMFGMSLQVVNVYGGISTGIFDSVTLPGEPGSAIAQPTVQPTPVPVPQADLASILTTAETAARQRQMQMQRQRAQLPDSGLGLFAIGSSLIGACAGWRKIKKMGKR